MICEQCGEEIQDGEEYAEPKAFYEAILDTYKIKELSELTLEQHGKILLEIKKLKGE